jgi:hypothetical protein
MPRCLARRAAHRRQHLQHGKETEYSLTPSYAEFITAHVLLGSMSSDASDSIPPRQGIYKLLSNSAALIGVHCLCRKTFGHDDARLTWSPAPKACCSCFLGRTGLSTSHVPNTADGCRAAAASGSESNCLSSLGMAGLHTETAQEARGISAADLDHGSSHSKIQPGQCIVACKQSWLPVSPVAHASWRRRYQRHCSARAAVSR